jgi:alkyl hydroperoxide reductase subunit AhpC/tRNA A-37 threonylcarbamoyl transferase component Bud32
VGEVAPDFAMTCVTSTDTNPRPVRLGDYAGRWLMLIFYPRDFTFVCPTELTAFSARIADFAECDCELLGISSDPIELHSEWLTTPAADGGLGPLQFPLASDPEGTVSQAYGVWVEQKHVSTRGSFIIDPRGLLQYAVVHNLSVGRSPDEVLRVLDALRTGGLCPAGWTTADGTIDTERALQPGRVLGRYRIRGRLGDGTFGTVFAAWDMRLERMVALKVLKQSISDSRKAVLDEARVAARLSHPHVCTIYAVDEEDGLPLIAMEHLDGRPLSEVIADGLGRESALRLATQIASGLAAAHQQDVVHGDLKPANVIVTEDGTAKVLDFGLARSRTSADLPDADARTTRQRGTRPGDTDGIGALDATIELHGSGPDGSPDESGESVAIRGTPLYMAPEQALGLPTTPAGDVFSFGLVLFEMLSGRRARSGQPTLQLFLELPTEDLALQLAAQVDEPYRDLLLAVLSREPAQRPTMAEVVRRLVATAA